MSFSPLAHVLPKGSIIYKRTETEHSLGSVSTENLSWFSETNDRYTYGNYLSTYKTLRDRNLIDLRNKTTRTLIEERLGEQLDPDKIYSGGGENIIFQNKIYELFADQNYFHGTYISHKGMDEDDEWIGANEIVLWNYTPYITKIKKTELKPEVIVLL